MKAQKVFVYRNLHQNCWSVKARGGKNAGRVILHADEVVVLGAEFDVNEKGRQKVLQEQRKNVHAGVVGWLAGASVIEQRYDNDVPQDFADVDTEGWDEVTYNPYKFSSFVFKATEEAAVGKFKVKLQSDRKVVATPG